MAMRKTSTRRSARAPQRRSSRKVARQWSREEIAFMRKYYRKFETSWVARQLGRTVYSIRYKAVDLSLHKANPSVWRGQVGPANAFKRNRSFGKTTRPTSRRKTTRRNPSKSRSYRATSNRRMTRKPKSRRTTRRTR